MTGTQREPARDRRPSPDDLWIAVTGLTGAGKSSFISLFADQKIEIGHGLDSSELMPSGFSTPDTLILFFQPRSVSTSSDALT